MKEKFIYFGFYCRRHYFDRENYAKSLVHELLKDARCADKLSSINELSLLE